MDAENYYQILGIGPDADDEAVKQAFREKAKYYHPDRNPGNAEAELRFKLIGTAYDALKDAARRESYNQYLAFNAGREKSERRQWGRLFGVIALLLLGPSAAFAAVYALGGMELFSDEPALVETARVRPVEQAREQATPAPAAQPQAPERATTPQPAPEPQSEPLPEREEPPAAPTELALNAPREPVAQPKAAPEAAPAPSAPVPAPQSAAPAPAAPPVEESRAAPPAPPAPPLPRAAPADEDRAAAPQIDPFDDGKPEPRQRQQSGETGEPQESDARASARLLAQLKEPDGATGGASGSGGGRIAALPREDGRKGTFVDCPACPVMSTDAPAELQDQGNVAVSLSEITVAEWNACVRDGVCAPYVRNAAPEAPVLGVSRRNATAYADWLSARSGESYRVVMTPPQPRPQPQPARNCGPENRGGLNGFEWLEDERPRAPCPPAEIAGEDRPAGFRVARKLRRQG